VKFKSGCSAYSEFINRASRNRAEANATLELLLYNKTRFSEALRGLSSHVLKREVQYIGGRSEIINCALCGLAFSREKRLVAPLHIGVRDVYIGATGVPFYAQVIVCDFSLGFADCPVFGKRGFVRSSHHRVGN
jgi:hypothetical protein